MKIKPLSPAIVAKLDEQEFSRWGYVFELQKNPQYQKLWNHLDKQIYHIYLDKNLSNPEKFKKMEDSIDNVLSFAFVNYSIKTKVTMILP